MERVRESEKEYRSKDSGVKYLLRGPKVDWGVILLKPGQSLGGHYHDKVEETFYILEGEATFYVDDTPHHLVAGDAVRLQAPERHDVFNEGDEPLKMLFIKCPYLPEDKVSCQTVIV
jgi:mannose-6-phosphate isomerase-like protein (cupin superfamily)